MIRLIQHQADVLFDIAKQHDWLEEIYYLAHQYSVGIPFDEIELTDNMKLFIDYIPDQNQKQVMSIFLTLLKEELKIMDVEVISAIPLNVEQHIKVERQLMVLSHKRVCIHNIVDESIIGGLKILIGNTIIDNSIKNQLLRLKEELYKGVFFKIDS